MMLHQVNFQKFKHAIKRPHRLENICGTVRHSLSCGPHQGV